MIYNFYVLASGDDPENVRYVGVTIKKIEQRFSLHKYCALHPEHRGLPVHKWMYSKYQNGGTILVKKIDECFDDEWEEKEQYWINFYRNKGHDLMNLDKGGKGVITKEKRDVSSIQRSIEGHEKEIIALNKDGSFFREFKSIKEATEFLKIKSRSAISNVLRGRSKSSGGYLWIYKDQYNPNQQYIYSPDNGRIPVYSFDYSGNLIQKYPYIRIFDELEGFSSNGVRSAIKNRTSYHDLYWSNTSSINVDDFVFPYNFKIANRFFKTQKDIAKYLSISDSHLSILLKGNDSIQYKNYKIERV